MKQVVPAILTDQTAELENTLAKLRGLTEWVQIDIMDGRFVPNRSITLEDLAKTKPQFNLEIDLMTEEPAGYFKDCEKVKAKRVYWHYETGDIEATIAEARKYSFATGLSLNPDTPVDKTRPYIDKIDTVLLMSVIPGAQSNPFIEDTYDRIKQLKTMAPDLPIAVDGGVNLDNIEKLFTAGADICAVGSAIIKTNDYQEAIAAFREKIHRH
ncbi:MAG: ribulose-phosphate 3-epimerase [Patescibacteria group bacterium]